ncbi:MAG TPA: hypothetical protein VH442_06565 [Micromonosporaceae bacterium]
MTYRRRRSSGETHPTLYARALRLKHIHPGGIVCFLLFEGAIGLAILMALAEFVTWYGVILLPLVVAAVVKINDLVAGVFSRNGRNRRDKTVVLRPVVWARGVASVPVRGQTIRPMDPAALPPRPPSAVYGVSLARRNDDASVGAPVVMRQPRQPDRRPARQPVRQPSRRHALNQRRFVTTSLATAKRVS